jgi:hypothetical protein
VPTLSLITDTTAGCWDLYLFEQVPDSNTSTHTSLICGSLFPVDTSKDRPLLSFDLALLPSGSTLVSAILALQVSIPWLIGGDGGNVYRATQLDGGFITEAATWNTYDGMNSWAIPGGEWITSPATPFTTVSSTPHTHTLDVTAQALAALAFVPSKRLWLLVKLDNEGVLNPGAWHSGNAAVEANRPTLTLTYTLPGRLPLIAAMRHRRHPPFDHE